MSTRFIRKFSAYCLNLNLKIGGVLFMAWQILPLSLTLLCAALSLELVITHSVVAKTQRTKTQQVWVSFTPPSGRGISTNRIGGGTRSPGCQGDNALEGKPFFSLIPDYTETDSERPSFAVHIPQTVAQNAFFSLRDASEDYSYETEIPLPETPGTYRLELPADAPPIAPNIKYHWSLSLLCRNVVNPSDPTIGGVIQFVESNIDFSRQ
jgi:hypothetical protein